MSTTVGDVKHFVRKTMNPEQTLLIDNPKVMETVQAVQIVINHSPDRYNPLDKISNLLAQFHIKGGDVRSGMIGGYQEIDEKGKKLDEDAITINKLVHKSKVINELDSPVDDSFGVAVSIIRNNWNIMGVVAGELCQGEAPMPVDKAVIKRVFSDRDATVKIFEDLVRDLEVNKEKYKARLGIGDSVGAAR